MRPFLAIVIVLLGWGTAAAPAAHTPAPEPACAVITRVVLERLGPQARVRTCATDAADARWTGAQPDAAARTGEPSWFVLTGPGQAVRVQALVEVEAGHVRAARWLPRGRVLAADDVLAQEGPLVGARLARLLSPADAIGARLTRAAEIDAPLQEADVVLPPVVRAGDAVTAVIRIGGVEVSAAMTAVDAGRIGDAIRIAHRDRKRVLQARVVGPGRVEVSYAQ